MIFKIIAANDMNVECSDVVKFNGHNCQWTRCSPYWTHLFLPSWRLFNCLTTGVLFTPQYLNIELRIPWSAMMASVYKKHPIILPRGEVFCGPNLHTLSGKGHRVHDKNGDYKTITDSTGEPAWLKNVSETSLIYVRQKNEIVMIGGECGPFGSVGIWSYYISKNSWKEEKPPLGFAWCNSVHCVKNNVAVMVGGPSTKMLILNLKNYDLAEYKMAMPIQGLRTLVAIGGGLESEMLVVGWIKQLFEQKEFKHMRLPPLYILQWIAIWFSEEDLHCFDNWGQNYHFVIAVKDIVASVF